MARQDIEVRVRRVAEQALAEQHYVGLDGSAVCLIGERVPGVVANSGWPVDDHDARCAMGVERSRGPGSMITSKTRTASFSKST